MKKDITWINTELSTPKNKILWNWKWSNIIFTLENVFENDCKMAAILFRSGCLNSLMHIYVSKLTNIGSDNGLSPGWWQVIIWTNAGILLIWTLGTNFSEILIEIQTLSLKKMHFKMSSVKWRPFCLGLNVLILTRTALNAKIPSAA